MKKLLMVGLLSAGLLATMLPGVAVAKDKVDTSACKKGGWSQVVREDQSTFADQAECVAYVAEGGRLTDPTPPPPPPADPTFESVCDASAGGYRASWSLTVNNYAFSLAPACLWSDITQTAWETTRSELAQFCPVYAYPWYWEDAQDQEYIYFGCTEAT